MKIHYLFNLIIAIFNIFAIKKFLHIYQLKNYNNKRYFKFFKNKKSLFFFLCLIVFIFEIVFKNIYLYIILNVILFIIYCIFLKNLIKSSKTPLIFTGKLSRIYIFSILIILLLSFYKLSFALIVSSCIFIPTFANNINIYDKLKNHHFIQLAKKKLKNSYTQIIAITGSNGKTSVKNILQKILETKFKTQSTPTSYNTPIGIAKFINNNLKKDTEFLILEYGARYKNDIKKLCKLYGADYGIITNLSNQHLETFKNIKNIYKAKNQLPLFLQNKPCVFNIDNLHTKKMFDEKSQNKLSVSIFQPADVYAQDITISNNKTMFKLFIDNKPFKLETSLLGRHNILNICLAVAIANSLRVEKQNIISAVKNLQPIKHRLELIKAHINIIDDSYNCSPSSAKEALWVLKNFKGKKMIATPGIIECGKEKYNINFNLGKQIAFCDFCVIIGEENKHAIADGIKASNLSPTILFSKTLEEAKAYFSKLNPNDTLLLLNDLPDDYK